MPIRSSKLDIVVALKDKASKGIKELRKAISKEEKQMRQAQGALIGYTAGITALGGAVGFLGKTMIEASDQYERTRIAFETMTGSAEKAELMLSNLSEFAKRTPFGVQGLRDTSQQLLGMGIQAENLLPVLKMLGDASAGTNAPIQRLALNLGQVRAKGKLTGRELRDFATAGIDLTGVIAELKDTTKAQVQEMVSAGEITYPMVIRAFQRMTSEGGRFNDLMYKLQQTIKGAVERLKESWALFLEKEGKALLEWAKKLIDAFTYFVNNVLPKFIKKIKDSIKWLKEHKVVLSLIIGMLLGPFALAIKLSILALGRMLITLAPFMLGGAILAGFVGLIVKLTKMDKKFKSLAERVGGWGNAFQLVFQEAGKQITEWAITVLEKVRDIGKAIRKVYAWTSPSTAITITESLEGLNTMIMELKKGTKVWEKDLRKMAKRMVENAEEAKKTSEELGNVTQEAFEFSDTIVDGAKASGEAIEKLKGKIEEIAEKLRDVKDKLIDTLATIEDKIWGLRDKEIGALQEAKNIYEEKMDIMVDRWKEMTGEEDKSLEHYTRAWLEEARGRTKTTLEQLKEGSEEFQKYKERAKELTDEIRKLKMGRKVRSIEDIQKWVRGQRSFLQQQVAQAGLQMPNVVFPKLQPIAPTPKQAVNNFSFDFSGAFIGNPEEFKDEVISLINRDSELKELAGE